MAPTAEVGGAISIVSICAATAILYVVGTIVYRLYFHPLAKFPGPIHWRISNIPMVYHIFKGDIPFRVAKIHYKYGKSIRISPTEVLFSDPQAFKEIYGHRPPGTEELSKDKDLYNLLPDRPTTIIDAPRDEHGSLRRQLSHGFSDKTMREQEPIINEYIDLLIQRLHENCGRGPLDLREWFNWTTFDIIGDLGFGSSFGCLEGSSYHPWVALVIKSLKESAYFQALVRLGFRPLVNFLYRGGYMTKNSEYLELVSNKLQERIKLGVERPDLIEGLIKSREKLNLNLGQMVGNASLLIIAGSETTATLLSGAAFLLTTNRHCLEKLTEEVRSTFKSEDEITLTSVGNLHYMLACLNEAFRCYPPVPGDLTRTVPKGGTTICGEYVAEGTTVAVWQWAINHNPLYWTDPMVYAPERWMGDPKYEGDRLDAVQPFSVGPRNCLGRNLAYSEMRLILARVIYNFDMVLADDPVNQRWLEDQKVYVIWEKPPLKVHLAPVVKKSG
ncbi:cytochrome P450 [Hypoxylon trugodes]|uniref:cytochrome P450 n=1 Tax=Hypoxylon trugodes TaxID=326681 RepID=UPI00219812FF|nr:cytochrome P450 [Hypoxylon trugodes]KAI1393328.1 cytochrome P450 [Hypoxylon trugodes]